MNIETKPFLKEVVDLYKKVLDFDTAVKLKYKYNLLEDSQRRYIKEDIDAVVDAFSVSFGLAPEESGPIKDALQSGEIDFMQFRNDNEEILKEEQFSLLYILSRPFFHSLRKSVNLDDIYWQEGRCAVCSSTPSLSLIEKNTQRKYFCSYCGSTGNFIRIGCPSCRNENSEKINIMYFKDTDDIRIDTCSSCKSYVKTFQGMPSGKTVEEMDLMSLPFDIVAQNKGFSRRSPNPVGIIKIK